MRLRSLPILALLALAGCSKIHEQRSFTLDAGDTQNLSITAPLSDQKIKVVLTSDQPVSIWVVLEKDVPGGKTEFDPAAMTSGVLASQKNSKEATLECAVPAKEKFRVFVNDVKQKANVTVKIDSQ